MSRRPSFEPIGFGKELEKTGNFATANKDLYKWTGTHWALQDVHECESLALKWIVHGNYGTASNANASAAYKTALLWLPKLKEASTVPVVPVLNGYIHLDGGGAVLMDHDKALGLRHVIECEYDPVASVPSEFNAFLGRVLPEIGVRDRVQEYVGYTLLSDAPHQIAQFWLGSGANGKGVLANIVQALHRRVAAIQLDELDGFNMSNLIDASLIYCDEAPQQKIKDRTFKMLTAAEMTPIQRKYRDNVSAKITGKWLILGNHMPELTDHSEGFWRRLDVVPFDVTIPKTERDPMLAKRIIKHELSGVLNWALEGVVRLLARGRFDPVLPPSMQKAFQVAQAEADTVRVWSDDLEIKLKTVANTPKAEVYSRYSTWCRSNGLSADSSVKFWKRLPKLFPGITDGRVNTEAGRIRTCNVCL